MKNLIILFLFIIGKGLSQTTPNIDWQKSIGGDGQDFIIDIKITSDGGNIMCGISGSGISGNKTEINKGGGDYWIVKTNNIGEIEWQKTFGGDSTDLAISISQNPDGTYIVAGNSQSQISGDKTQLNNGLSDYWILKLNSIGEIIWQKTIGDNGYEGARQISQTTDGGYFFGGDYLQENEYFAMAGLRWRSGLCDILPSKNFGLRSLKDEPTADYIPDYQVIKLDSEGEVIWQRRILGNHADLLKNAFQTADGNYIVAGHSDSSNALDKNQNPINNNGVGLSNSDYWILKLDNNGNTIWQRTLGSTTTDELEQIIQTKDGGYLLGGNTWYQNNMSGNIQGNKYDPWIIKIDANGNYQWDKIFVGSNYESIESIQQTIDGDFLLGCYQQQTFNVFSTTDLLIIKTDSLGNEIWRKTINANGGELLTDFLQTPDKGFIIACSSNSAISGDKTVVNFGSEDFWLIKLVPELLSTNNQVLSGMNVSPNPTSGTINIDFRQIQSSLEIKLSNVLGQLISSKTISNLEKTSLEINEASGVYFLEIVNDKHEKQVFKVIKN